MQRTSGKKKRKGRTNLGVNSEVEGWDLLHKSNRTGRSHLKWEKEKIGVGQIGREISALKLSVNMHFDISFHEGIFFFPLFSFYDSCLTAGDRSAAEADHCSTITTTVTWGPLPACHSRWTMHNLSFLLMPFFIYHAYIVPNCSQPLILSWRS